MKFDTERLTEILENSANWKELIIGTDVEFISNGYGGLVYVKVTQEDEGYMLEFTTDVQDCKITNLESEMETLFVQFGIDWYGVEWHNSDSTKHDKNIQIFLTDNSSTNKVVVKHILQNFYKNTSWDYVIR